MSSPLQELWVTLCHRRSTQMYLSLLTGVITGGEHWGVLTTTAFWTPVGSLWLWRLNVKDKSRLSSAEQIFCIISATGGMVFIVLWLNCFCFHFLSPGSPQMRASAGSPTTSQSSLFSLQVWHQSLAPRRWLSVFGVSGLRKMASPCG